LALDTDPLDWTESFAEARRAQLRAFMLRTKQLFAPRRRKRKIDPRQLSWFDELRGTDFEAAWCAAPRLRESRADAARGLLRAGVAAGLAGFESVKGVLERMIKKFGRKH
jgi:hypothetical protein